MQASAPADELDVISEADLFLNYGRDAQAEDLLKEALQKKPGNAPILLKLLSIYAVRKDVTKFTTTARQIKDSGDQAAWEQAAALGHTVDPGNPMYGEASGAAPAVIPDILAESGKQSVKPLDMDVGFNIPMDLDVTASAHPAAAGAAPMDFDVSAYTATPAMDMDVTGGHQPEALLPDFDVTGGHPPSTGEQAMDFDVTGSHPNVTGATSMDFDVTGSHPNVTAEEPASVSPEASVSTVALNAPVDFSVPAAHGTSGGMDFDLSASPSATAVGAAIAAPAADEETYHTGMDFDLSAAAAPSPAPAAAPAAAAEFSTYAELGGLDFDITGGHAPVAPEEPGENMSTVVLSTPMDLDIGSPAAATGTEASYGMGGLDFNITGERLVAAPHVPADSANTVVLNAPMDFDISAPSPTASPAAETPAPLAAEGMDFNLGASSSVVIPAAGGALAGLGGMDFDLSTPQGAMIEPPVDLSGISLDVGAVQGAGVADTVVFPAAETKKDDQWQEVENKLDLAKAFLTGMGDVDTARELLGEVLNEGDAQQVETARSLIQQI